MSSAAHRAVTATLAGLTIGLAVEAYQTAQLLKRVQAEGVFVTLPAVGRVHVAPPATGSGPKRTVDLTPAAQADFERQHKTALAAAVTGALLIFVATS
jgi:hypothetical protein